MVLYHNNYPLLLIYIFISAKAKANKEKKKKNDLIIEGGYGTGCCCYVPNNVSIPPQNQFVSFEEAQSSSSYHKCPNPVDKEGCICPHCKALTCTGHQYIHCCTGINYIICALKIINFLFYTYFL